VLIVLLAVAGPTGPARTWACWRRWPPDDASEFGDEWNRAGPGSALPAAVRGTGINLTTEDTESTEDDSVLSEGFDRSRPEGPRGPSASLRE
jgi:hypothetical protein